MTVMSLRLGKVSLGKTAEELNLSSSQLSE